MHSHPKALFCVKCHIPSPDDSSALLHGMLCPRCLHPDSTRAPTTHRQQSPGHGALLCASHCGGGHGSPHGEPTACAAGPFRICLCTTTSIINIILFFVIFRPRWLLDTHRQPAHSIPHLTISHVIIQDMARYPLAMRTASGYYAR